MLVSITAYTSSLFKKRLISPLIYFPACFFNRLCSLLQLPDSLSTEGKPWAISNKAPKWWSDHRPGCIAWCRRLSLWIQQKAWRVSLKPALIHFLQLLTRKLPNNFTNMWNYRHVDSHIFRKQEGSPKKQKTRAICKVTAHHGHGLVVFQINPTPLVAIIKERKATCE